MGFFKRFSIDKKKYQKTYCCDQQDSSDQGKVANLA